MKKITMTRRQFRQFLAALLVVLAGLLVSCLSRHARDRSSENGIFSSSDQEGSGLSSGGAEVSVSDMSGVSPGGQILSSDPAPDSEEGTAGDGFGGSGEDSSGDLSLGGELVGVHVTGAVLHPDQVYYLPEGSRIADAIGMAGGPLENADLSRLNLAAYVADGERIRVPAVGEDIPDESLITGENAILGTVESSASDLTNINTASKIELMELPGIGETYADRIIAYREQTGGFLSIQEIMNVQGIGERKFESLKDLICV